MGHKSYFHDPIHGQIWLSPLERAVVDTLEFQRLRFIRQMSLMHYVFPGAFHTRFAHSIGTCHNSHLVTDQLFPWISDNQKSYAIQVFHLTCLLHDVGHGAFSHSLSEVKVNGEPFLPSLEEVLKHPGDWEFEDSQSSILKGIKETYWDQLSEPVAHEALSAFIIHGIFKYFNKIIDLDNFKDEFLGVTPKDWAQDISGLLFRNIPSTDHFNNSAKEIFSGHLDEISDVTGDGVEPDAIGPSLKNILSQMVSGSIDTDRMDYLLRDSASCGVNYGLFDRDGIISAIHLVKNEGQLTLAINSKRTNTVDDFLWSRYQMFRQVYCHKTHNAYNLLLSLALGDLVERGQLSQPKKLTEYLRLTDDFIMSMVFGEAQKNPGGEGWVQAFSKRKLPQFLGLYESGINDSIWNRTPKEIYSATSFEKYKGWEEDPGFLTTTQKTEVIRTSSESDSLLPLIVSYNKSKKSLKKESYLTRSVFFNSDLEPEEKMKELSQRINKKLIFFYRLQ